ncbi:MAG: hypothetical protein ACXADC_12360 [Candidatus Thorarchaeota archaeon]|jgi:hypothetical protein
MQSPDIILSNELFTVAVILWVGTFSLLFWLFFRMNGLTKTIATLSSASDQDITLSKMPSKTPVYIALILELVGVAVLLAGLIAWIPIPLFPMSIVVWAGVFIMLFWQMMSIAGIEESLASVISKMGQE